MICKPVFLEYCVCVQVVKLISSLNLSTSTEHRPSPLPAPPQHHRVAFAIFLHPHLILQPLPIFSLFEGTQQQRRGVPPPRQRPSPSFFSPSGSISEARLGASVRRGVLLPPPSCSLSLNLPGVLAAPERKKKVSRPRHGNGHAETPALTLDPCANRSGIGRDGRATPAAG